VEGLHALTATVAGEFTHDGTSYRLGFLDLADWGDIEASLLRDRPDPLAMVVPHLKGLSEDQQRILLGRAYEDARLGPHLRTGELEAWLDTLDGGRTKFWFALRKHHPDVDREQATLLFALYTHQQYDALQSVLKTVEGGPVGNSPGPEGETATDESLGSESSETSSGPTDGPSPTPDE
jgi:hypothetical protein